jgi:hypothetical protein
VHGTFDEPQMVPARPWDRLTGAIGDDLGKFRQLVHLDAQLVQPVVDPCGSFSVVSR